jgi:hypothetical protein
MLLGRQDPEAPRHIEDAWRVGDRVHAQVRRPRGRVPGLDEMVAGCVESLGRRAEHLALLR